MELIASAGRRVTAGRAARALRGADNAVRAWRKALEHGPALQAVADDIQSTFLRHDPKF